MDCVWVAMETSSLRQTLPDKKTSVHLSMERKSWNVQFHELAKHVKQKTSAGLQELQPHRRHPIPLWGGVQLFPAEPIIRDLYP